MQGQRRLPQRRSDPAGRRPRLHHVNDGDTENTVDDLRTEERTVPPAGRNRPYHHYGGQHGLRPNLVIDCLTAIAVRKGIEPVIVLNKADLKDASEPKEIYEKTRSRWSSPTA